MKVTMLLADAAQAVGGKLYILGGGWSLIGPDPTPMALALKIAVPWDRSNLRHRWSLELIDSDGRPATVPGGPDGSREPITVGGEFEAGRPPGIKPGSDLDVTLAINFAPIELRPNTRYEWRLRIEPLDEEWRVGFSTRPRPVQPRPGTPEAGQT